METDWESMYRSWKEGLGWINRNTMFTRCDVWLSDMQDSIWCNRDFGRTGNYVLDAQENQVVHLRTLEFVSAVEENGNEVEAKEDGTVEELDQFQWP